MTTIQAPGHLDNGGIYRETHSRAERGHVRTEEAFFWAKTKFRGVLGKG